MTGLTQHQSRIWRCGLFGKLPFTTAEMDDALARVREMKLTAEQLTALAQDAWQEHSHFVANTRWWPRFCAAVDWLAAAILIVMIAAGVGFHS